jgi:hypothetical protein
LFAKKRKKTRNLWSREEVIYSKHGDFASLCAGISAVVMAIATIFRSNDLFALYNFCSRTSTSGKKKLEAPLKTLFFRLRLARK